MVENKYIIRTENLSFTYDDEPSALGTNNPAVSNVTLGIKEGEYLAILGHNGSGKSTLAKLFNMILVPTSGKIFIDGEDVSSPDISDDVVFEVRKKIGMVFQNPDNQLVATVVDEDVAFGPENLGVEREEIIKRVYDALSVVDMTEYAKHAPHKLSGGQKQRVAIAGVIAMKPKCIIFDESTAMLDPKGRHDVVEIMERLNREEGITVVNITHHMDEAARADRIVVINDGEICMDGKPEEVFARVDELHSMGLEAPQGIELLHELKKSGFDVGGLGITTSECVDAIANALLGE